MTAQAGEVLVLVPGEAIAVGVRPPLPRPLLSYASNSIAFTVLAPVRVAAEVCASVTGRLGPRTKWIRR
jgi:hypothetical protein